MEGAPRMRFAKQKKKLLVNSKGSAIITVIVSMLFVMALGLAILFAAYTGYSIEITQRGDKENFYNASAAMDDMRVGIQTLLSDSVAKAYTSVLTDYVKPHASDYNPQKEFNNKIIEELSLKKNSNGVAYFVSGPGSAGETIIKGYNVAALRTFIDAEAQSYSEVTGVSNAVNSYSDGVLSSVSLTGISVKYLSDSGYESNITTDITIAMPYFFASSSVTSGINNYAIIADTSIIHHEGGEIAVDGSVFAGAGGISLSGGLNKINFSNGDLICKGTISVDESSALSFNATGNQLWANDIKVGSSGNINLDGSVYVANDLLLSGNHASATLKNTYFGFGNSTDKSKESSSIITNGRNCELNISGLSKLNLAGISFIETSGQGVNDSIDNSVYSVPIPMGESLSVKSDQLAYLVPVKCISNFGTNPCVFPSTATNTAPTVDLNTVLWGTGEDAKTLGYYITGKGSVKTLYKNIDANWKIVYAFMFFSDKKYANEYFRDYFAADPAKIEQYMNIYLSTLSDKAANAKISTAGNIFYNKDGTTLTMNPASDSVYAAGAQMLYSKMQSPYFVFVNTNELSKLGSTTLLFEDSATHTVVAVVSTEANYDYSSASPSTIRLIISSKDVTLSDDYAGIVMAGQNVIVNDNVTGQLLISDILNSTCTVGTKIYTLSDFINNSAQIEAGSGLSEDLWDLDSLVYYANWLKH